MSLLNRRILMMNMEVEDMEKWKLIESLEIASSESQIIKEIDISEDVSEIIIDCNGMEGTETTKGVVRYEFPDISTESMSASGAVGESGVKMYSSAYFSNIAGALFGYYTSGTNSKDHIRKGGNIALTSVNSEGQTFGMLRIMVWNVCAGAIRIFAR